MRIGAYPINVRPMQNDSVGRGAALTCPNEKCLRRSTATAGTRAIPPACCVAQQARVETYSNYVTFPSGSAEVWMPFSNPGPEPLYRRYTVFSSLSTAKAFSKSSKW